MTAESISSLICSALRRPNCTIINGAAVSWGTVNSRVFAVPAMAVADIEKISRCRALACNLVKVDGETPEGLHFHTSFLVASITSGPGTLHANTDRGELVSHSVREGDVIVIPRGALHVFSTQSGNPMEYIALEFADGEIDYQAHHSA